jgi:hypothetical protein
MYTSLIDRLEQEGCQFTLSGTEPLSKSDVLTAQKREQIL